MHEMQTVVTTVSVCLSVCHAAQLAFAVQKLNGSRCCLWWTVLGPVEHCVRWGFWSPNSEGVIRCSPRQITLASSCYNLGYSWNAEISLGEKTYIMQSRTVRVSNRPMYSPVRKVISNSIVIPHNFSAAAYPWYNGVVVDAVTWWVELVWSGHPVAMCEIRKKSTGLRIM